MEKSKMPLLKSSWRHIHPILCKLTKKLTYKYHELNGALSIAGSETTASTLAVTTYHVCKDREILKKLQQEIRGSFTRYEDIDSLSTGGLRYLHAVCSEALRIFPPLPLGLPRVVPAGGDTVDGHYIPEGVNTAELAFHSED